MMAERSSMWPFCMGGGITIKFNEGPPFYFLNQIKSIIIAWQFIDKENK
jgi:hypothetical protein